MKAWSLACSLCLSLLPTLAHGSALSVAPTQLRMHATERAGVFELSNHGAQPVEIQIRVRRWTQEDGKDVLIEQDAIVASPQRLRLDASARQMVRLYRRSDRAPATGSEAVEAAYRVIVDQLPEPGRARDSGLTLRFRMLLPLIVTPADVAPLKLSAQAYRDDRGLRVAVRNEGGRVARITSAHLNPDTGVRSEQRNRLDYVLPGATMPLVLTCAPRCPRDATTLVLGLTDAQGQHDIEVPLAAAR